MKFSRPLSAYLGTEHSENVVSINSMRLRKRIQQVAGKQPERPQMTRAEHLRKAAIKRKTGGFWRG